MDLKPVITTAGLAAVFRATSDGVNAQITHVALGDGGWAPDQTATALKSEKARYPVAGGDRVSEKQIHLTAMADGDAEFWVREIAFLLSDGTVLALWSDTGTVLAYKAAGVELLLAYDLTLSALPADSVTVAPSELGLSLYMAEQMAALATAHVTTMTRQLTDRWAADATAADLAALATVTDADRDALHQVIGRQSLNHYNLLLALTATAAATLSTQKLLIDRL